MIEDVNKMLDNVKRAFNEYSAEQDFRDTCGKKRLYALGFFHNDIQTKNTGLCDHYFPLF